MRFVKGLEIRQISPKSYILEDTGAGILSQKMIVFNSTAAYLWTSIGEKEFTPNEIAELLIKKYSVSQETGMKDSESIIRAWMQASLIEC